MSTVNNILVGDERLAYGAFFRKYNTFREAQVNTKVNIFTEDMVLPFNSCLHLCDSIYSLQNSFIPQDIPNFNIPFIANETSRKCIYHIKQPNTNINNLDLGQLRFVNRGLFKILNDFRAKNTNTYKPIDNLNMSITDTSLLLVNHNPLARIKIKGVMTTFRKMTYMLTSILNTVIELSSIHPNRTQYIMLPVGNNVYNKDKFLASKKNLNLTSIKDKDNYGYILMLHWLNFIDPTTANSIFEIVPEAIRNKINLIFYTGKYYVSITLADAILLNTNNKLYNRFINQYNSLILSGIDNNKHVGDIHEMSKNFDITEEEVIDSLYTTVKKQEATPKEVPVIVDSVVEPIETINEEVIKEQVIADLPEIERVVDIADTKELDEAIITDDTIQLESSTIIEDDIEDTTVIPTAPENTFGAITTITPATTGEQAVAINKDYISTVDADGLSIINSNPNLTIKEKKRLQNLAVAYKDIIVDGKTIEEILLTAEDPSLNDNTIDTLKDYVPDKSMLKASIYSFDSSYMKKQYLKDMIGVAISFNKQGLFLTKFESEVKITTTERVIEYKFQYVDVNGKTHTVRFTVPFIEEDGTFVNNGTKSYMRKQMTALPICKVSPTRVNLASNYNKTIVERNTQKAHSFITYFTRLVNKISEVNKVNYEYQHQTYNERVAYEYTEISKTYKSIDFVTPEGATLNLKFNLEDRIDYFNLISKSISSITTHEGDIFSTLEKKYGLFIGRYLSNTKSYLLFINISNIVTLVNTSDKSTTSTNLLSILTEIFKVKLSSRLTEWTNIKILDKQLPVGFLLCYNKGFRPLLDYLGVKYIRENKKFNIGTEAIKPPKYKPKVDDIVLKFKDCNYYIPRYPLRNSLILTGLTMFNISNYLVEDFDSKDVYFRLLIDNGFNTNYLKGIDDTFTKFIDPITFDTLKQMNEPTNFLDLLIRATDMLTVAKHEQASSMTNHRVRTFEQIPAITYNVIARELASYQRSGSRHNFSLNPNAVILKILQNQTIINVDDINPVHDAKTSSVVTYVGAGGRQADSVAESDRVFADDAVGILSEATVDSGSVAMVAQLAGDANVVNTRGMVITVDKNLDPANVLSTTGMLMPGATQDDGKRGNFINIQLSHQVPTENAESMRIRTGYERVLPHLVNDLYAITSKQDGKVILVDEDLKVFKIQYADGSIYTYTFGELYGNSSDIVTTQTRELLLKEGDTFSKGEVIAYNPDFFEKDAYSNQVDWKHGVLANVAIMEVASTYEDSNILTSTFGKKLSIKPVQVRTIVLDSNTLVHNYESIGTDVGINTPLIIFEDGNLVDINPFSTDDMSNEYLAKMNRKTPKAKYAGTITNIEMLIGGDISDLHPSLQKMYKVLTIDSLKKYNLAKDSNNFYNHLPESEVTPGTKLKGTLFTKDTVVLKFYITEVIESGVGDKVVLDSSLKTVTAETVDYQITTESGVNVDCVFSGSSISNRIVNSPLIVGMAERVMDALEQQIVEEYFEK